MRTRRRRSVLVRVLAAVAVGLVVVEPFLRARCCSRSPLRTASIPATSRGVAMLLVAVGLGTSAARNGGSELLIFVQPAAHSHDCWCRSRHTPGQVVWLVPSYPQSLLPAPWSDRVRRSIRGS